MKFKGKALEFYLSLDPVLFSIIKAHLESHKPGFKPKPEDTAFSIARKESKDGDSRLKYTYEELGKSPFFEKNICKKYIDLINSKELAAFIEAARQKALFDAHLFSLDLIFHLTEALQNYINESEDDTDTIVKYLVPHLLKKLCGDFSTYEEAPEEPRFHDDNDEEELASPFSPRFF